MLRTSAATNSEALSGPQAFDFALDIVGKRS
jgi:hypothetical protein